jgi:mono/diheme cytochrome c family protein
MRSKKQLMLAAGAVVIAGGLVALGISYRPGIQPIPRPDPMNFEPQQVADGAKLAAIGDCTVCHTAEGGKAYAGGRALETPFGTLYATNITPDEVTGIGSWSFDAFRRAMAQGVSRDGHHLYPALPYEHFTHVSEADLLAIYAFLMTREAVHSQAPANELIPPLGFRPLLAGWKLLFLHQGPTVVDASKSTEWNRGAYLVEGLGHCGGCHTPRNLAGGEEASHAYAGGIAEGWVAPPLNGQNPSKKPWTPESLYVYLRTGVEAQHSAAAGPMGPVVHDLAAVPEEDVRAIATYIASKMSENTSTGLSSEPVDHREAAATQFPEAAALFAGACADCHDRGAPMMGQGRPALSSVTSIQLDTPDNVTQVILSGIPAPLDSKTPYMPPFAAPLTDPQISGLVSYLRARFSGKAAWQGVEKKVTDIRKSGEGR